MDSKSRSKPMRKILERVIASEEYDVIIFGDKVILDEAIENWPICDILISFYSKGFPLEKAVGYSQLRKPFCVNDLSLQYTLLDRRLVHLILDSIDVPTPYRITVNRDDGPCLPESVMEIVGRDFNIDFSRNLFPREDVVQLDADTIKVGHRIMRKPFVEKPCSGEDHNVFIYFAGGGVRKLFRKIANKSSEFFPDIVEIRTEGSYIYEEFIQSDTQEDIKVYTVGLNYSHAETRKSPIVDGIVRRNADGKEVRYVTLLSEDEQEISRRVSMAFGQTICGFDLLKTGSRSLVIDVNGWSFVKGNDNYYDNCAKILRETFHRAVMKRKPSVTTEPAFLDQWKLKAFLGVFRHADRTPKQKVKVNLKCPKLGDYIEIKKDRVIKRKEEMILVKEAIEKIIANDPSLVSSKLQQLLEVLEIRNSHADTKLQLKPLVDLNGHVSSYIVIVKWGGEFTHAGRHHSKDLGDNLQRDLMMLNKKIVDEVSVYSSSERRALATADVFSKAFLPLAELPSDFIKVNKEWLDDNFTTKEDLDCNRSKIIELIKKQMISTTCNNSETTTRSSESLIQGFHCSLKEMRQNMLKNYETIDVNSLQRKWCCSESPLLFKERWEKLIREFCDSEKGENDIFKLSEIYDSLKYDGLHNRQFIERIFSDGRSCIDFRAIFEQAKVLFKRIAPLEYGVDSEERIKIGRKVSSPLLKKLIKDLQESTFSSNHFTRLYFTKESHMYTLLNLVLYSEIKALSPFSEDISELDYLSQICFEVYEKRYLSSENVPVSKFSVRIGVSPGAHSTNIFDLNLDSKHSISVAPKRFITEYLDLQETIEKLERISE